MKPGLTTVEPLARNTLPLPAAMSTVTVSSTAGTIWQATVRFQMSS
jgi:hypothetical protein